MATSISTLFSCKILNLDRLRLHDGHNKSYLVIKKNICSEIYDQQYKVKSGKL